VKFFREAEYLRVGATSNESATSGTVGQDDTGTTGVHGVQEELGRWIRVCHGVSKMRLAGWDGEHNFMPELPAKPSAQQLGSARPSPPRKEWLVLRRRGG
jgi:hypothetical protein